MSEPDYVYVISGRYQKIGHSKNPKGRLAGFKTSSPYPIALAFTLECGWNAERAERLAHDQLKDKRLAGEWFDVTAEEAIEAVKAAVANVQGSTPRVAEVAPETELAALKRQARATNDPCLSGYHP